MNFKKICLALACCVTATLAVAGGETKAKEKDKAQPMSEPNPVKAYVHVVPQNSSGEGKGNTFLLCEHSQEGCERPQRTKKHLAVSNNPTFQLRVDTAKENNSQF
jgi:hypothetical protein